MFGINFIKFDATTYVVHYKKGKIKKEGKGLSFYYSSKRSSIVAIPLGSDDVQFIFNELTDDFQSISIQGQVTYKITNPKQLAELLDFTVDKKGNYNKANKEKINQRLINEAQTSTSAFIKTMTLKDSIRSAKKIEEQIFDGLSKSKAVQMLGIEPLSVNVIAVKPLPETEKALEASTRESLQKEADLATYERRNFGVEQERRIKESELNTEIAVEEKRKQIEAKKYEAQIEKEENSRKLRKMRIDTDTLIEKKKQENKIVEENNNSKLKTIKINSDIEIEENRKKFIDAKTENDKKIAEVKAYEIAAILTHYKDIDWKILMAMNPKGSTAKQNIAMAFRELAENSQRIQNLNITPDLLTNLMQDTEQTESQMLE